MELKLIRTKKDYRAALVAVDRLWDAPAKSPAADQLDVLTLLVEQYELKHFPIAHPDPIDFLGHVMKARGLTRKDLEPYIGPRGRVSAGLFPAHAGMNQWVVQRGRSSFLHCPCRLL